MLLCFEDMIKFSFISDKITCHKTPENELYNIDKKVNATFKEFLKFVYIKLKSEKGSNLTANDLRLIENFNCEFLLAKYPSAKVSFYIYKDNIQNLVNYLNEFADGKELDIVTMSVIENLNEYQSKKVEMIA